MIFTNDMKFALKAPEVKMAWVSENESPNPNDCKSCGGSGYVYLFLATGGPFNSFGGKSASKFYDGKWWIGSTQSFACPDCSAERPPSGGHQFEPRLPYRDDAPA